MSTHPDFPCPSCHHGLPHDATTAGREVTCPHCEALVFLPEITPPAKSARPVRNKPNLGAVVRKDPTAEQLTLELEAESILENARRNFPLHNSQPIAPPEAPIVPPEERPALPPGKEKTAEEEQRRLAAMAANLGYDHAKFEKKGMLSFACPLCNRPLWVSKKESGLALKCEGCGSSLLSPRPELGLPAQLKETDESAAAQFPKAVLPTTRQVEDLKLEEGRSGGRAKRHPSTPQTSDTPAQRSPIKLRPVPARGDETLSGQPVVLPSERISQARTLLPESRDDLTSELPEPRPPDSEDTILPRESKREKGAVRLNNRRRNFSPQKIVESNIEITDAWGPSEHKAPHSRRIVIIAWLCLIPLLLGIIIWGMQEVFRKKEPTTTDPRANEINATRAFHLSRDVLEKFFTASSVEEMSRYVRHPEATLPRMKAFYKHTPPTRTIEAFDDPVEGKVDDVNFISGLLTLQGQKSRSVALEIPPETSGFPDDLRIDWESMVYWSEVPWDQFMGTEMTEAHEFRVTMQLDDYPVEPYQDQNRWVCFKLYNPGNVGEEYGFCFGYVEVNSPTATDMILPLRRATEEGQRSLNAILKLRFIPESRGRKNQVPQVMIDQFTNGWLKAQD